MNRTSTMWTLSTIAFMAAVFLLIYQNSSNAEEIRQLQRAFFSLGPIVAGLPIVIAGYLGAKERIKL